MNKGSSNSNGSTPPPSTMGGDLSMSSGNGPDSSATTAHDLEGEGNKGENDANRLRMLEEKSKLAQSEHKAVSYLRVVVFCVLSAVAIFMSVGVYFYTNNDEVEEFEAGFMDAATLLIHSFHDSVESQLGAIGAMSVTITANALATNQTFPFVLVNDFELQAANVRVAAKTVAVQWTPILKSDEQRRKWEDYALEHRFHIDEAFDKDAEYRAQQDEEFGLQQEEDNENRQLQQKDDQNVTDDPELFQGTGYHPRVWNVRTGEAEQEGLAPYVVAWQRSPVNGLKQKFLNLNIAQAPALEGGLVPAILNSKSAVINKAIVPVGGGVAQFSANLLIGQYREHAEEYSMDPVSFVAYPVFDSFEDDREIAGLVVTNLYWRIHFANVLANFDKGYICVLENSFGQSLRYRVDGENAVFLGEGPHNDTKYSHMEQFVDVNEYVQARASVETRAYKRAPLDQSYSRYTLKVYPSEDTEAQYRSNKPAIYTALVCITFLLTTVIFLVYDYRIAKRQKIVMDRALQSGAIVASLFPEKVRDRMYEENKVRSGNSSPWSNRSVPEDDEAKNGTIPNADIFQNTIVLFADLKGFTAWSAKRDPTEVFTLLEALYTAFDSIADRRSIFKIETIGDCYVAVAGLPNPQEDHAVRMVRFAGDCIAKMSLLVIELSETLGEDTAGLQLRVGLHSGPVTAGVLKGQRSRFQLFGDTVNTAARMESNGVPGRIHVSGATAAELRLKGKESWLTARQETIIAKGKGEMQTYFAVSSRAHTVAGSPHVGSADCSAKKSSTSSECSSGSKSPKYTDASSAFGVLDLSANLEV